MAYSTQQLIDILEKEMRASCQGQRVLLSAEERFNDPVLSLALGHDKIGRVYAYREFREQIHHYQQEHQVSGLIWRTCQFQGETVRFPELHNQLVAIDSDKQALQAAKADVVAFWRETTPGLKLWLMGKEQQILSPELVEMFIGEAEWAEVDAALTEVYLGLCWGKPEERHYQWALPESGCRRIVATRDRPTLLRV
ncbi:MAG: hypothetical protein F6J87_17225 [Spirulina sp. SIO3F2]|nr:hypothetical protein [Spirulina sp. SIO3F2]